MSDFDVVAQTTRGPGGRCYIAQARDEMTDQQVSDLNEAMAKHSAPVIAKVLRQWGFQISETTVQRHRRGMCLCE